MTDYTIITTDGVFEVEADRYRRDPDGDLYCYVDDQADDPVAHVEERRFIAIYESDRGLAEPSLS